jgi:hypothetical protein
MEKDLSRFEIFDSHKRFQKHSIDILLGFERLISQFCTLKTR